MVVTKKGLKQLLEMNYLPLNEIFNFTDGQDCMIYKTNEFDKAEMDDIVYIPDIYLNEIPINHIKYDEDEIDNILIHCITKQDFLDECKGNEKLARDLFDFVDWQHPDIQDLLDGWNEFEEEEFYKTYGCSLKDFY